MGIKTRIEKLEKKFDERDKAKAQTMAKNKSVTPDQTYAMKLEIQGLTKRVEALEAKEK